MQDQFNFLVLRLLLGKYPRKRASEQFNSSLINVYVNQMEFHISHLKKLVKFQTETKIIINLLRSNL